MRLRTVRFIGWLNSHGAIKHAAVSDKDMQRIGAMFIYGTAGFPHYSITLDIEFTCREHPTYECLWYEGDKCGSDADEHHDGNHSFVQRCPMCYSASSSPILENTSNASMYGVIRDRLNCTASTNKAKDVSNNAIQAYRLMTDVGLRIGIDIPCRRRRANIVYDGGGCEVT